VILLSGSGNETKKARRPLGAPGCGLSEFDCRASQAQGSALLLALLSLLLEETAEIA